MAALSMAETGMLRNAMGVIDAVLREGFDKDEPLDSPKRQTIVDAKNYINAVVQKKGYYVP